jgi:hypothetical protein
MDTKEQIAKALALLSPPSNQRTECERDISLALDRVERAATFAQSCRAARSKKKSGLTSYYAALRRLLSASRGLDPAVKPWLSFADPAYVTGKALEEEIDKVEALLNRRSKRQRRHASRSKAAVAAAHDLLRWWKHEASVTRRGKWAQLAKVLAGDLSVDFFDHLRAFRQKPSPAVEKLRRPHAVIYRLRGRQPDLGLAQDKSSK